MTVTGGGGGEGASVPAGPEHQPGTLAPPGPEPATVASPEPSAAAPAGPEAALAAPASPEPRPAAPAAAASLPLPWALAVALTGGLALTAAFPPVCRPCRGYIPLLVRVTGLSPPPSRLTRNSRRRLARIADGGNVAGQPLADPREAGPVSGALCPSLVPEREPSVVP